MNVDVCVPITKPSTQHRFPVVLGIGTIRPNSSSHLVFSPLLNATVNKSGSPIRVGKSQVESKQVLYMLNNTVADPELNLGGFLEARRAEWGGYGRGVPSRWWGFGGPPPRKF